MQKKLLHLSYIRTVRYAVRNNVNSFCLRPIQVCFGRFPWYLFSTTATAELCRRSTAYWSHGRLTRSIGPHWEVSLSSHVSSPFRKAVPNFETSYLSLILSESWRMVSLAARFHTGRVINVLAELIFYCQVTWSFYSPYTCIGVEVWYLTTVFYCDFKSLLSLHKILRFFLLMFCWVVCRKQATSFSVLFSKYIAKINLRSSSESSFRQLYSFSHLIFCITLLSTSSFSVRNSWKFSSSPLMFPFNAENWISCL